VVIPILSVLLNITLFMISLFLKNRYLSFILFWWLLWFSLASVNVFKLTDLNQEIYFVVYSLIISILLGAFYAEHAGQLGRKSRPFEVDLSGRFVLLIRVIVFCYVSYISFKFYSYLVDGGSLLEYRAKVFTDSSPIYTSKISHYFARFFIGPLGYILLFIGISFTCLRGDTRLLVPACVLFLAISIVEFGRFGLYNIIFFAIIYILNNFRKMNAKFFVFLVSVFIVIFAVTYFRSAEGESVLRLIFELYIIKYHTLGFYILNFELSNPQSIIHDKTLGLTTVYSIFDPVISILRYFSFPVPVPESGIVGKYLDDYRYLGTDINGDPFYSNAFGTILFGLYRDGGLVGVALFGSVWGFMVHCLFKNKNGVVTFAALIGLLHLCFFGIFQPNFSFIFISSLIFIVFCPAIYLSSKKNI